MVITKLRMDYIIIILYYNALLNYTMPYIESGWDDHRFLFVALLVLALVCFIVLVIGLACIRYRSSRGSWSRADDEVSGDKHADGSYGDRLGEGYEARCTRRDGRFNACFHVRRLN